MKLIMCSGVPLKFFSIQDLVLQYLLDMYSSDTLLHDTNRATAVETKFLSSNAAIHRDLVLIGHHILKRFGF
jgi:hypothetical protein